ncbi:glycosyltransferase family 2 protein [Stenotrophomonas geniculata]|uniref:glycosyltransferase family 2 protein n=1 Tax=Stenotrophomonas geniculata TaxID=86188 RepID=UPI0028AC91D4|nr:glycosyltransferase family 2 protein [Stenotrophomonas geniculata]
MSNRTPTIVAVLTSHNRKEKTMYSIRSFWRSIEIAGVRDANVILVDDGSSDGTSAEASKQFPGITILHGNGSLFWCRGMSLGMQAAIDTQPDYILWLNDDTEIVPGAIQKLINCTKKESGGLDRVVVGATVDPETRAATYGGLRAQSSVRQFSFVRLGISDFEQSCDAMNGNIVLIPRSVFNAVGTLDSGYEHAMGDIDYALRSRSQGFEVIVAPGYAGYCSSNSPINTHSDRALPFSVRWAKFCDRKGLPPKSWRHFVKKHAGLFWPCYFVYPYLKFATRALLSKKM